MHPSTHLLGATLLGFASALNQYPSAFNLGSAPADGYVTFAAASSNPNVSHTVSFRHYNGSSTDDTVSQDWTWTISVSDVLMPNASTELQNAHVAYTTYEFSWPESGNLNEALSAEVNSSSPSSVVPSCAFIISAPFSTDISSKWDPDSSDCTSALGADCVATLTSLIGQGKDEDCMSVHFSWQDPAFQKDCTSAFNTVGSDGYGVLSRGKHQAVDLSWKWY